MSAALRRVAIALLATGCSLATANVVAVYKVNLERDDATLWGTIATTAFGRLQADDFADWAFEFHYGGFTYEFPASGTSAAPAGCPAAGCGVLAGLALRFEEQTMPFDEGLYFGQPQQPGVFFDAYGATVSFMPRSGGSLQTYSFRFDGQPYTFGHLPSPSSLALAGLGLGGLALMRRSTRPGMRALSANG